MEKIVRQPHSAFEIGMHRNVWFVFEAQSNSRGVQINEYTNTSVELI